ncbi:hypothetical protein H310_13624 [Aphanomyces invadans]|uniref:MalT-like TPR region domain-containing protein n=1 Tax=Aphanomyces invadans TaxID=157072 RepID=A0A024TCV9_9STRA|nr:hypothetical protein H310_13624 [Aphanomyces invadans]ETV91985.1 hypothetical protein H310_13624 [Aphanomyces invadans]|eukprot:XP_008879409.1 hypothetical protein H310_13624 [Aphanomyces invadans]
MKPHEVSLGLSLAYFHEFVAAHGGRTAFEDLSTANVCTRFVMPTTELSKLSLVDHVLAQPGGDKFAKPAQWLISHSWSYKFLDVVDAIDNFCHEHALDMDTSFWFCMFANNQHAIGEPTVMFDVFLHAFRTALADTGKMVMVLSPWHDPATLKRTWCVYEVYLSIVLNARFEVAMGKTQQAAFLDDIHELESINRMRAQVNCKHSSTTVPSDRDHIFKLIDDTVGGTDKLDRLVFEVMQTWVLQTVGNQVKVATTPEDRFRWLFTQAQTLVVVGRCTEALEVYQSAMDLFAANLPLTFWRGWQALYRFAELKAYTGQPRELWEPMFDEAVPRLQTLLGKDHNVALSALREAGFWLCRSGCTDRYRKMLTDCLALETRKADDNDDMIKTLHYLGDCCLARNKCAEAEQLYHQAYEGYCRLYGPTHVRCRTIQGNFAVCYSRQGRYQDAAQALAPVLDESMRTLGPHHHETINQMGNVGIFHRLSGKYVEADELLRQCIQKSRAINITSNLTTWLRHRALVQFSLGHPNEAIALAQEAYNAARHGPLSDVCLALLSIYYIHIEHGWLDSLDQIDVFLCQLQAAALTHETWTNFTCRRCTDVIDGDMTVCMICPRLVVRFCPSCADSNVNAVCDHANDAWLVLKPPYRYLLEQKLKLLATQRRHGWQALYTETGAIYTAHCDRFRVSDRVQLESLHKSKHVGLAWTIVAMAAAGLAWLAQRHK